MKKLDNFIASLKVLERAEQSRAQNDEIYRIGVIGQFNLTFELAWKALKEMLIKYGVSAAKTGSPREVLKEGYAAGFLIDDKTWLDMMTRRNISVHAYDEKAAEELIALIFAEYIPSLKALKTTLEIKAAALDKD